MIYLHIPDFSGCPDRSHSNEVNLVQEKVSQGNSKDLREFFPRLIEFLFTGPPDFVIAVVGRF